MRHLNLKRFGYKIISKEYLSMNKLQEPSQTPARPRHQPLELLILVGFVVTWLITKDAIMATMVLTGGTAFQILVMLTLKMPMTKMQKAMSK